MINPITYAEAFKNRWKRYTEVITRKSNFLQNTIAEDVAVINITLLAPMLRAHLKLFSLNYLNNRKIHTSRIPFSILIKVKCEDKPFTYLLYKGYYVMVKDKADIVKKNWLFAEMLKG